MIRDILGETASLSVSRILACTPTPTHPFFQQCARRFKIHTLKQQGHTLGNRLQDAFTTGFSNGFDPIVIIGSDSPTLPVDFIYEAFRHLHTVACVVGPALDGGYYLVGARGKPPPIFNDIDWGTDQVLTQTLRHICMSGISCHLLPFWYDVDRPADMDWLITHLSFLKQQGQKVPTATMQVMDAMDQLTGLR